MISKIQTLTDIRQTVEYANYLKRQGWIVERINSTNYFIKKIFILGSVLKIQRPKEIDFKVIQKLEKKYNVFQTIIEPDLASVFYPFSDVHNLLLSEGYKLSNKPFLPSKTLQIDIRQSMNTIYRKFTKDCRYSIKRGEELAIKECSTNDEIEIFRNAWKKSINFNRYVPSLENLISLKKSFPQNHSLFVTSHNKIGSIIGGAIFTVSSHEASNYITYYWQGFTNKEGRSSLSQYSLLYFGILWAKKQGSKLFDFEGIYDDRFPNKSWLGFTYFKKQFGGIVVKYPGCYTKFKFSILNSSLFH